MPVRVRDFEDRVPGATLWPIAGGARPRQS